MRFRPLLATVLLVAALVGGCPTNTGGETTAGDLGAATADGLDGATTVSGGTASDAVGDTATAGDSADGTSSQDAGASGTYDPDDGLLLEDGNLKLDIPADATEDEVTITAREAGADDLPVPVPGDAGLAGGVFGPAGQTFDKVAEVSVQLGAATAAPRLPVLTYDTDNGCWIGTGVNATVAANGLDVTFPIVHFSTIGVPDPIPMPVAGDPIDSFVVISNDGTFSSEEISSSAASLIYSEFGDTFSISMTSQEVGGSGISTSSLGLTAQSVTESGNLVIGVCAGGRSIFNGGDFNESAYGVMTLSVNGGTATVVVFVATPERVIFGTLTGQTQ